MTSKKADEKEADYLHPDGAPSIEPRTKEEKENLEKAKESTELVEKLEEEQSNK